MMTRKQKLERFILLMERAQKAEKSISEIDVEFNQGDMSADEYETLTRDIEYDLFQARKEANELFDKIKKYLSVKY